jgi:8-oxo-dGTP pyrophosphatase MutT (NUDIX family)
MGHTPRHKLQSRGEFSAGAVIFYREVNGPLLFLLLQYSFRGKYWDFPRGNLEQGERSMDAAKREIEEETGLREQTVHFVPGFSEVIRWVYVWEDIRRFKRTTYFLAEAKTKEITLSEEHQGYTWLPFQEAVERVTYHNTKQVLEKAHQFIHCRWEKEHDGQTHLQGVPL